MNFAIFPTYLSTYSYNFCNSHPMLCFLRNLHNISRRGTICTLPLLPIEPFENFE